jgi:hypothetical protein
VADCTLHYTDNAGSNAIGSQIVWCFEASQPPGEHPFGAYFTDLGPETPNLAKRLRIPRSKLEFMFCFEGREGLKNLPGGRGEHIFYSPEDYLVDEDRQEFDGPSHEAPEQCK